MFCHPCNASSSTAAQDVKALSSKLAAAESRAAVADAAFASASAASKKIEDAAAVERSAMQKQLQLASGEGDTYPGHVAGARRLHSRTRADQLLRNTELHDREVAALHGSVDAALRGAEEAEALMKKEILEVQALAHALSFLHF